MVFDLQERNVFYAIGTKNNNFEQNTFDVTIAIKKDNIRLEKFFIEVDSFSSKTLAYLQLNQANEGETVASYRIS